MNVRVCAIFGTLLLIACSKDGSSGKASGSASATSAAIGPCAPFVDKMASVDPAKTGEKERKLFATMCGAVSPEARTCVEKASGEAAINKCLEGEKKKIGAAVMGAAIAEAEAKDAAEAKKPPSPVKIDKLGLQIDIRGEAQVGGALDPTAQSVMAASIGNLSVGEISKYSPTTLEKAKSQATSLFKPKHIDSGPLSDGYWLSYDYESPLGKSHKVTVRRKLGKKSYDCESAGEPKPEQATAILEACKTLRL